MLHFLLMQPLHFDVVYRESTNMVLVKNYIRGVGNAYLVGFKVPHKLYHCDAREAPWNGKFDTVVSCLVHVCCYIGWIGCDEGI